MSPWGAELSPRRGLSTPWTGRARLFWLWLEAGVSPLPPWEPGGVLQGRLPLSSTTCSSKVRSRCCSHPRGKFLRCRAACSWGSPFPGVQLVLVLPGTAQLTPVSSEKDQEEAWGGGSPAWEARPRLCLCPRFVHLFPALQERRSGFNTCCLPWAHPARGARTPTAVQSCQQPRPSRSSPCTEQGPGDGPRMELGGPPSPMAPPPILLLVAAEGAGASATLPAPSCPSRVPAPRWGTAGPPCPAPTAAEVGQRGQGAALGAPLRGGGGPGASAGAAQDFSAWLKCWDLNSFLACGFPRCCVPPAPGCAALPPARRISGIYSKPSIAVFPDEANSCLRGRAREALPAQRDPRQGPGCPRLEL